MSEAETSGRRSRGWVNFSPPKSASSSLRLVCFPYAGGTIQMFSRWRASLPRQVELGAVELPGHGLRLLEKPLARMEDLVGRTITALEPYLDRPLALFGHSMGGLIAFEVARALRRADLPTPVRLYVSGRGAPQLPDEPSEIHKLPTERFRQAVGGYGATPADVLAQADIMRLIEPALRADFAICETYRYTHEDPLDCPIHAFWGFADQLADRDAVAAWREQTSADFSLRMIPGAHFFIQTAEKVLLQLLTRDLEAYLAIERSVRWSHV
jgi:medium-chain acyl-[acyl-carrier-protein] hydrolase